MPETKGVSARGDWQRQEVIFEMMDGAYMRKVAVTFFNKPADVAGLAMGVSYTVSFNVESREYNDRWYTDIRAWRVAPATEGAAPAAQPQQAAQPVQQYSTPTPAAPAVESAADDVDDLPF